MTAHKPQRPRLERRRGNEVSAFVSDSDDDYGVLIVRAAFSRTGYRGTLSIASLSDIKRLHAFLAKAIAYLEASTLKRGGRK